MRPPPSSLAIALAVAAALALTPPPAIADHDDPAASSHRVGQAAGPASQPPINAGRSAAASPRAPRRAARPRGDTAPTPGDTTDRDGDRDRPDPKPPSSHTRTSPTSARSRDTSSADSTSPTHGTTNPLLIENPLCRSRLAPRQRRNCRTTGTPESRYPTSNYGLDVHVDTGIDNIPGNFQALLAQIANAIWQALLFVLNLVLTLFGWAFELNPFADGAAMGSIASGLERFYRAFTSPWLLVAIVCVGAWGLWRSIVRRDYAGGIAGTLVSLGLMMLALWIVFEPAATVGRLARIANTAAKSVVAAPQRGSLADPTGSFAEATSEVWSAMTLPGFAVLNFSSVEWALERADPEVLAEADEKVCADYAYLDAIPHRRMQRAIEAGGDCDDVVAAIPPPRTNADIWLRSSPGSPAREALWEAFDDNGIYDTYLAIQGGEGAWTRLPLVLVVGLGLLGGILLLAWLAIRLLVQAALAFVLVLSTPIALFLPAFGEGGRRAFGGWLATLLGALVSKLVYAGLLSVVLFATSVVASLVGGRGGLQATMAFLVSAGLWWSVFLKREEIVATLSAGPAEPGSARLGGIRHTLATGQMLARPVTGALGLGAGAAALGATAAAGAAGAAVGTRSDRAEGTRRLAQSQIDRRAAARLEGRAEDSRGVLAAQASRREELASLGSASTAALTGVYGRRGTHGSGPLGRGGGGAPAAAGARGEPLPTSASNAAARGEDAGAGLSQRRQDLRDAIAADEPREAAARDFLARAEERQGRSGARWSRADLAAGREAIRREADRPVADPVHAWRVGLSPDRYRALEGAERVNAHRRVGEQLRQDRLALGTIPDRPAGAPDPAAARAYRKDLQGRDGATARRAFDDARRQATRARRPSRRGVSR